MSFNQNFYTSFHEDCSTFHCNTPQNFLIPSPPPPYAIHPLPYNREIADQDFVTSFEINIVKKENCNGVYDKPFSIREFKQHMQNALITLDELKEQEKFLSQNIKTLPEIEWDAIIEKIKTNKNIVSELLSQIPQNKLALLQKLITKRASKRLRQKKLRALQKHEKEKAISELQERSRRIDEHLQKIKDDLYKVKQQKEAKQQADIVLKEVLRKKHDAKKWIVKLDALVKLRKARLNTNKGQGIAVSEKEAESFIKNIENLKSLWTHKSVQYENEEAELRDKLNQNQDELESNNKEFKNSLLEWRKFLFGDMELPQVDFNGDVQRFISNRLQWDQYINNEGSPLPIGWITPRLAPAD